MIARSAHIERLRELLGQFPVVGLIGARQVGKTTLAKTLAAGFPGEVTHFDLENPRHLYRLEDPLFALENLTGLVILDEIQLRPEIFPVLRVLADREGTPARFLVLGSASPELLRQGSESLAGRIAFHELGGLSLEEVGEGQVDPLWLRGGFPLSYLAASESASTLWRQQFIRTYLERDLSELGVQLPATPRCGDSVPCSPTTTARSGTARSWPAPLGFPRRPSAAIWTLSARLSWPSAWSPGTRTWPNAR